MRIAVPHLGKLDERDARLMRLAEFLGIEAESVTLDPANDAAAFLRARVPADCDCLVVHPRVFETWLEHRQLDPSFARQIASRFRSILVHGLRVDPFDKAIVTAFTGGPVSIRGVLNREANYSIGAKAREVADAFAGLLVGPVDVENDRVIAFETAHPDCEPVISIEGVPFMVRARFAGAEVFVIASDGVADLDERLDVLDLPSRFSRLLPHAMALRHAAGDECWRCAGHYASLIIDDPLLRPRYGFLHYDSVLRLCKQENFHTSIAFIPHNWKRTSPRVARLFRENRDWLSICLHGNDHTDCELAATDSAFLRASLRTARERGRLHFNRTGIPCDEVLIFPKERFSLPAMREARLENFEATVCSTTSPAERHAHITLGDFCLPAVTRYGGFPLFIRNSFAQMTPFDIAFRLFFGRAILVGEHHDLFRDPERVVAAVRTINSMAPGIRWVNPASAVAHTYLRRIAGDTETIRAFARTVSLDRLPDGAARRIVSWQGENALDRLDGVRVNGDQAEADTVGISRTECSIRISPGAHTASLIYRGSAEAVHEFTLGWRVRAMLRRRLSEIRDNHLSVHAGLLSAARAFQRRFLRV